MVQRKTVRIATPKIQREGGGFSVRKVIGGIIPVCDPFIMLDHIGPVDYKPGEAIGAPDHPHRGFETVTYIIDGGVKHRDSAGNQGTLKSGWVQWMTAGRGVVHSEMPPDDLVKNGGRSEGFQLWVNLPAKHKMTPPKYQEMSSDKLPFWIRDDGAVCVKVISGQFQDVCSPMATFTPILILDICLKAGSSHLIPVPVSYSGFIYVWRGSGCIGSDSVPFHMGQVGLLTEGDEGIHISATAEECRCLLVSGEAINEPIAKYGPFVMNTDVEIQEAIIDYQADKMGVIDGKEERIRQTENAKSVQIQNGTWSLHKV